MRFPGRRVRVFVGEGDAVAVRVSGSVGVSTAVVFVIVGVVRAEGGLVLPGSGVSVWVAVLTGILVGVGGIKKSSFIAVDSGMPVGPNNCCSFTTSWMNASTLIGGIKL